MMRTGTAIVVVALALAACGGDRERAAGRQESAGTTTTASPAGGDGGGGGNGDAHGEQREAAPPGRVTPKVAVVPPGPARRVSEAEAPPEPYLRATVRCLAALRERAYGPLVDSMTDAIESGAPAPVRTVARVCRGVARLNLGDLRLAVEDLDAGEKALGKLPSDPDGHVHLLLYRGQMVARAQLGDGDRARSYLDRAIRTAPGQEGGAPQGAGRGLRLSGSRGPWRVRVAWH